MISANNVTYRVGKKALFEDVNIKFTEGNCYGLIGANGAGKSTFLKILSGQLDTTKGDIVITPGQRLSVLEQDHFKYDDNVVMDTVIMGNERLFQIMKEKDAIYAKEDFSDEDGIRASELEAEFAELVVCVLIVAFFRTRLGLSIRATGDNADMVRASSINPAFTITVGLCLANSLTGLAGCLIGQLNKSCDINLGTGMVTVALASLVIGESLMGRGSIARRVFGVVLGAVLYRLIIAVAISTKIVPTEGFKLVSALIVAVASATPYGRKMVALQKQKLAAKKKREGAKVC